MKIKIILIYSLLMAFYCDYSFAQAKKDIIAISTYYPSPYGSYNEVSIEEGVQFQTVNPIQGNLTCDNTKEGKLVYGKLLGTETTNIYYFCNGASWKAILKQDPSDVAPCNYYYHTAGEFKKCSGTGTISNTDIDMGTQHDRLVYLVLACQARCGVVPETTCFETRVTNTGMGNGIGTCHCARGAPVVFTTTSYEWYEAGTCID